MKDRILTFIVSGCVYGWLFMAETIKFIGGANEKQTPHFSGKPEWKQFQKKHRYY